MLPHDPASGGDTHPGRLTSSMASATGRPTVSRSWWRAIALRRSSPAFAPPGAQDQVIDLRKATVLPGLMDMHVHLTEEASPGYELARYKKSPPDYAFDAVVYADRTLKAGFTTVRDCGDIMYNVAFSLRNAINAGKVPGAAHLCRGPHHREYRWARRFHQRLGAAPHRRARR